MKRSQPIQINIPNTCSQKWDNMTQEGQGRHCAHCSKTVIDFTDWSDAELYGFFANNRAHVCGRFLSTQMGRQIHIPYQPHSRLYRMAIAMGLTLMFVYSPELHAQNRTPIATATVGALLIPDKKVNPADSVTTEIHGVVTDNKKEPLVNATVKLFQNGVQKSGVVTDFDGRYSFKLPDTGSYKLSVSYVGYEHASQSVQMDMEKVVILNFVLQPDGKTRKEVITVRMGLIDKRKINNK